MRWKNVSFNCHAREMTGMRNLFFRPCISEIVCSVSNLQEMLQVIWNYLALSACGVNAFCSRARGNCQSTMKSHVRSVYAIKASGSNKENLELVSLGWLNLSSVQFSTEDGMEWESRISLLPVIWQTLKSFTQSSTWINKWTVLKCNAMFAIFHCLFECFLFGLRCNIITLYFLPFTTCVSLLVLPPDCFHLCFPALLC